MKNIMKLGPIGLCVLGLCLSLMGSATSISADEGKTEPNPEGWFDPSPYEMPKKQLRLCSSLWSWEQAIRETDDQLGNPFDVIQASGQTGDRVPFRIDRKVEGAWVRLIPASYQQATILWKPCRNCAQRSVSCKVPVAWKALDSVVLPHISEDLRRVDQCVVGSDEFCLTRVTSLGGLGFLYSPQVLPEEKRAYGYLSWSLSSVAGDLKIQRNKQIRAAFRINAHQPLVVTPLLQWFKPGLNNLVRQVRFSGPVLDKELPLVLAGEERARELQSDGKNEAFLPMFSASSVNPPFPNKGSVDYFRNLLQGAQISSSKIPGFELLDVGHIDLDGKPNVCSRDERAHNQECHAELNQGLYELVRKSIEKGLPITVDLVMGGEGGVNGESATVSERFQIDPTGNIQFVTSDLQESL
ncbi:hypothetical protein WDW37_02955 [Bdellovibrionota bacterium FG-1]